MPRDSTEIRVSLDDADAAAAVRCDMSAQQTKMIGQSEVMDRLREQIEVVGLRRCTVLIRGETGTGKELVARHIHRASGRAGQPFVPVDCTTLPESLIESQLFGHVKGAFTGANQQTLGFIRAADGGTLFLDEIGELPGVAQAKLLRCIQERVVVPVGSVKPLKVNVRIVAATHRDLQAMVSAGKFREDLYYRLNVAQIRVPALRQRIEDISDLATHFLDELATLYEEPVKRLAPATLVSLCRHSWPGNVRELSHAIEHAATFCPDRIIEPEYLCETVMGGAGIVNQSGPCIEPLEVVERRLITQALRATDGNQTQAARLIQIERHRLHRKIVRYGLESFTRSSRG